MIKQNAGNISTILKNNWAWAQRIPFGRKLFSRFVGKFAPYSGTIGAEIVELENGFVRAKLQDRRGVRNHLQSVHAMALANFAEFTSGIGLMYSLPAGARGILVKFEIEYLKKARGCLQAESRFVAPQAVVDQNFIVDVMITNPQSEVVAKARATWRIGPSQQKGKS